MSEYINRDYPDSSENLKLMMERIDTIGYGEDGCVLFYTRKDCGQRTRYERWDVEVKNNFLSEAERYEIDFDYL